MIDQDLELCRFLRNLDDYHWKRKRKPMTKKELAEFILNNTYDGDHHKAWLLDQLLRILLNTDYEKVLEEHTKEYNWDVGIPP